MKKSKVVVTTLDEFGKEKDLFVKWFKTKEEAEDYAFAHEQEYSDNPEVYCVYIE